MIGYIVNCIQYERPFTDVLWFVLAVFVGVTLVAQVLPNYVETRLKPLSLRLLPEHIRVDSSLFHQFQMCPLLLQLPFLQQAYCVRHGCRGKPVGDDHRDPVLLPQKRRPGGDGEAGKRRGHHSYQRV